MNYLPVQPTKNSLIIIEFHNVPQKNKRYKEKEDKDYIPTYEEIVHDSDGGLSEDEKTLDQQAEFEHKYNFRFEEPDAEYVRQFNIKFEYYLQSNHL